MPPTRVLVTLSDLYGGGAQRVVLTLLAGLPRGEFELHLALAKKVGPLLGDVPDHVQVHDLGASRVSMAALPLIARVRRLRPQVVFSTLFHMNQLLLLMRPLLPRGTRLVIREGITASHAFERNPRGRVAALLLRVLYPTADRIVCQCRYMADDLADRFSVPRERMTTIYNPIDLEQVRARAKMGVSPFAASGPGPHVVGIGRLDPQKGFDRLIRSLPELREREPGAELWILGEDMWAHGRNRRELVELARALGVAEQVHFTGYVDNPYPYLAHADLFVLSSRYEGLPNVLLEALALGCPVLALDGPGGTREIMELTGQSDRLVPELAWKSEWLRGRGPVREPDLSAFCLERAVRAYADVLRGALPG